MINKTSGVDKYTKPSADVTRQQRSEVKKNVVTNKFNLS